MKVGTAVLLFSKQEWSERNAPVKVVLNFNDTDAEKKDVS